ncbi:MAG TPA: hypothetical protein P5270_02080 [Victivallales bacterium]|nr:hypothetical protein [Victivallales bacterium]
MFLLHSLQLAAVQLALYHPRCSSKPTSWNVQVKPKLSSWLHLL